MGIRMSRAIVVDVDAPPACAATGVDVHASIEGKPTAASAVLRVHLIPGERDPAEAAGELRRLLARARTIGLSRMVADFDPADRTARSALDASGLDWQVVDGVGRARAVVTIG